MRRLSILCVALIVILVAERARAADWFVSNVCGNPANADGGRANPFADIAIAVGVANAGDTIRVLPSAENAQACPSLLAYERTTITKDLCIVAEAGPVETLSEGFAVEPNVECTIRGFTITNPAGNGIDVGDDADEEDRVTIENCVIVACAGYGIEVVKNGQSMNHGLWVKNCVVSRCTKAGIRVGVWVRIPPETSYQQGATIENSVITRNAGRAIEVPACRLQSDGPDITIRFCHIADNNAGNEQIGCEGEPEVVITDPILIAPTFVDEDLCDYRLTPNSPFRHQGNPACLYLNPDGTRNDPGAFGGPGATGFYGAPGPVIEGVEIEPAGQPGRIRVRVWVRER